MQHAVRNGVVMLRRYGQVVISFQALQVHLRFAAGDTVFNPNNESHAQVAGCCSLIPIYIGSVRYVWRGRKDRFHWFHRK